MLALLDAMLSMILAISDLDPQDQQAAAHTTFKGCYKTILTTASPFCFEEHGLVGTLASSKINVLPYSKENIKCITSP